MFTDSEFEAKKKRDREFALNMLRAATFTFPEQRIGQLISNALHHTVWASDTFSLPDATLAQHLDEYTRGVKSTVREEDAAAEIARLRVALQSIDEFVADAVNPVKVAPNAFTTLAHIRLIAQDALKAK